MTLNIKNERVDRLARRAADLRKTGITEAVEAALEQDVIRLEKARKKRDDEFFEAVRRIQAEIAAAPVLDPRSSKEIMDELNDDIFDGR